MHHRVPSPPRRRFRATPPRAACTVTAASSQDDAPTEHRDLTVPNLRSPMSLVVQKFGGSSVADAASVKRVADR
ncbi:MAG: hypothetical protein DI635_16975, partial [Pseudoxanthomonas suwonensis]